MKQLFILLLVAASTFAYPVDPSDEVELVEPISTNEQDPETIGDGFPILVISTRSRRPSFDGFPFLRPSSFFGNDERFDDFFPNTEEGEENLPEIPADSFFPGGFSSIFGGSDGDCGILCQVFKNLDTHIRELEKEVKEVRDKQNEIDGDGTLDSDQEGSKSVYEEKVLDDGRVLKINKTTFSDTNEDGTSFFSFSSTSVVSDDGNSTEAGKPTEETEIIDNSRDIPIDTAKTGEDNVERLRRSVPQQQQQQWGDVQFDQQQQSWDDVKFDKPLPKKDRKKWKPEKKHPTYSLPINLEDDTRVNEIISETASRGGLVFLDPDSELLERGDD